MKKALLGFLLAAGCCFAQQNHYIATATTTAMTLQQPASSSMLVEFPTGGSPGAWVSCAAAQTATLSWNGTAATATAGTANRIPGTAMQATVSVFTGSNVGAGTTASTYPIAAGAPPQPIDLSWVKMGGNSTAVNLTISTTGSCTITFMWSER